jgi:hypothetical protein
VTQPALETEISALEAGGNIRCHQRRLDQQGAGTTHRIDDRRAFGMQLRPPRTQQHGAGQIFLERCFTLPDAVSTSMQGRARQIQRHGGAVLAQQQVQAYGRLFQVNTGSRSATVAKLINDGVLHFLREIA